MLPALSIERKTAVVTPSPTLTTRRSPAASVARTSVPSGRVIVTEVLSTPLPPVLSTALIVTSKSSFRHPSEFSGSDGVAVVVGGVVSNTFRVYR